MRGSASRWGFAALVLLATLVLVARDLDRTAPGPLNPTHAQDPTLAAGASCKECHGGIFESMALACAECHAEVTRSIDEHRGLHGTFEGTDPSDCAACHLEHHGDAVALVTAASFERAGVPDRDRFDHRALDFALGGRHLELACVDCHANAEVSLLARGDVRFLGLVKRCDACHEDVHAGRIVRDCADCHGQEHPFAEVQAFSHARGMKEEGAHAGLACSACHVEGTAHAVEELAGAKAPPDDRTCQACHDSPHGDDFVASVGRQRGLATGASCAACHDAVHRGFAAADMPRELHGSSGFALDAPHDGAVCANCHAGAHDARPATFAERYPGRDPERCEACHDDPHAGQFGAIAPGAAACLDCHARHTFDPSTFDAVRHAATDFALTGAHERTGCAECHREQPPGSELARRFRGTTTDCEACHADVHGAVFASVAPGPSGGAGTDCAACHRATEFSAVPAGTFDHGSATAFALEGAHARAECASCHARAAVPDALGRSFARATVLAGHAPGTCSDCHVDAHKGAFEARSDKAGAGGCASCHSSEDFRAVPVFDHARWTSFALRGAHERAQCTSCHHERPTPDETGRRFGRVAELVHGDLARCESCHADPHRGAFERAGVPASVDGRSGCVRCHTETSFEELALARFDHALFTGYPLEREHAGLSCATCHAEREAPDALGRRFARAAGTACNACHADPHAGQFAVAKETDCARCHADDLALVFDHRTQSRFALDETHARLDCADCHVPWPLPDGSEAIRYKPLGTSCADCHAPGEEKEWRR